MAKTDNKGVSKTKTSGTASRTGSHQYTHEEFTYVRRKRKPQEPHETGELNIVPYLDIMVNLIMFMLVTQSISVALGVVDVTAPTYAAPGVAGGPKKDPRTDLKLTVGVAVDGFYIAAKGGVLGDDAEPETTETTPDNVAKRPPTIPKLANGRYNYDELTRKLRGIKTLFPDAVALYLAADQGVTYAAIVRTLDASRSDSKGELFPAVAFSRLR